VSRAPKLTPAMMSEIWAALEIGLRPARAARLAGLEEFTVSLWLRIGRADAEAGHRTRYSDFFKGAAMARARCQHNDLQFLGDSPDWRARAWRLEKFLANVAPRRPHRRRHEGARS
jgi:hypothetical protein